MPGLKSLGNYLLGLNGADFDLLHPWTLTIKKKELEASYQQCYIQQTTCQMRILETCMLLLHIYVLIFFLLSGQITMIIFHIVMSASLLVWAAVGLRIPHRNPKVSFTALLLRCILIQTNYLYSCNTSGTQIDGILFLLMNYFLEIDYSQRILNKLIVTTIHIPNFVISYIHKPINTYPLIYLLLAAKLLHDYSNERHKRTQYCEQVAKAKLNTEQCKFFEELIDDLIIVLRPNSMSKNTSKQIVSNRNEDASLVLQEFDYEFLYKNKAVTSIFADEFQVIGYLNSLKVTVGNHQKSVHQLLNSQSTESMQNLHSELVHPLLGQLETYPAQCDMVESQKQNEHKSTSQESQNACQVQFGLCRWLNKNAYVIAIKFQHQQKRPKGEQQVNQGILFGSVSHELKTPLHGMYLQVQSAIQIAKHELSRNEKTREILNILVDVQHNNYILQSKINDLLDFQRLESGIIEVNREEFDLNTILDSIKELFISQFQEKKVHFSMEVNVKTTELYSDLVRLKQVLINLIGNALKFTFKGWVKLHVTEISSRILQFEVADSGIGIPEELKGRLCRLQAAPTSGFIHGAGIGLTIAQRLVGMLGPEELIHIDSTPNEGSRFTFKIFTRLFKNRDSYQYFLPSEVRGRRKIPSIKIQHSEKTIKMSDKKKKKAIQILIVDDTSINVIALRGLLSRILKVPSRIDEAYNGVQAVELYQKSVYELIFMDINMPIMDGLEAIRIIREIEGLQSRKAALIVVVTAYSGQDELQKSRAVGADYHMEKPLMKEKLRSMLDENFDIN